MANFEVHENKYINFQREELDQPIYRVIRIENLLEILCHKRTILRKPLLWDDPFENLLTRTPFQLSNGTQISFKDVMLGFYGQCWTLIEESDAMWRIYAPHKDGVKIKTNVKKLLDSIYDINFHSANGSFFIGKVFYETREDIMNVFSEIRIDEMTQLMKDEIWQALMLLIKREEFKHESEIRLLFRSNERQYTDAKVFDIEPNGLFDEVIFDPRMNNDLYVTYATQILPSLNYKGKVGKSHLYDPPSVIKLPPGVFDSSYS